jgi:hypothetical protein
MSSPTFPSPTGQKEPEQEDTLRAPLASLKCLALLDRVRPITDTRPVSPAEAQIVDNTPHPRALHGLP